MLVKICPKCKSLNIDFDPQSVEDFAIRIGNFMGIANIMA